MTTDIITPKFPLAKMMAFAKYSEKMAQAWNASSSQGRRGRNSMNSRADMIHAAIESYKALAEENATLAAENEQLKRKCHVLEYGAAPGGYTD